MQIALKPAGAAYANGRCPKLASQTELFNALKAGVKVPLKLE
jgi:hypothetical protein